MTDERYHLAARLMHWIMVVGFVFMWGCGYAMTSLVEDDSPLEEFLFDLHISVGVTLLALLVLRIAIPPDSPAAAAASDDPGAGTHGPRISAMPRSTRFPCW